MAITLIPEDGSGIADANTYAAQADADAYFANRANATWAAASADAKAAALIQATQYLDARYTFKGVRLTDTQALEWPRQQPPITVGVGMWTEVIARDSNFLAWPVQRVKDACCEAALRALAGPLYQDQDSAIVLSEKVGEIAVSYAESARNGGQIRISIVDDLLRRYVIGSGANVALVRA